MEDFERWEKISEWRGYTIKAIENLTEEIKELKQELKVTNNKLDIIDNRLTTQTIKVGVIGGTMGLIAGGLITFILGI